MEEAQRRSAPPRSDDVISQERYERYHRFAREKGTSRVLYYVLRCILAPAFLVYLRLQRSGREHARFKGGLIVASNHRSFLDPFVIGAFLPWRRRLQFVAKVELFEKALAGLGALAPRRLPDPPRPGRRDGDGDRAADRRTRRDRGHLSRGHADPHRLAGAAEARRRPAGARDRRPGAADRGPGRPSRSAAAGGSVPRKVKLRAGKPLTFPRTDHPSPALAATVTDRIWPNIELQWEWLGGLPPLRKAAVIGAGSWGTAVAVLLARGGLEVELGTRTGGEGAADRQEARERGVPARA